MEQQTGSKLGKEYIKAVYCHLAYLTYMQSSVQLSHSVMSGSLLSHGLQHARPPCPSPVSRVYTNSCPSQLLSSPSPPAFNLSHIRVFSNESVLHIRWPKYSTSHEMLGWMKHKLESRLLAEISIASDMQMTSSLWQKAKKNQRAS